MEFIDLSYPIQEGMLTFDAHWHPKVRIEQLGRIEKEGRESRKITLGTHTGTHVDAPLHFIKNGKSVDMIPLERLNGPVSILDFSNMDEKKSVSKDMLLDKKISSRILFKFSWGKNWGTQKFYQNYPFFTKEASEFLISKKVKLIAYDAPSPDDSNIELGSERDSEIHKLFLGNDIILVEYLANLELITDYNDWNISVNPLKITGADGSPARVFLYR